MPIFELQKKWRELGRLRIGQQVATASGGKRPSKLKTWRVTSASRDLLEAVAALYGGVVGIWADAPTEGEQYEVVTTSDTLPIAIPPGDALTQWLEMWSAGGCQRRCDGQMQQLPAVRPCTCPPDPEKREELSKEGKACSPHSRLSVVLPEIPDLGVWRLETKSWNAAEEMLTVYELMREHADPNQVVAAKLRIDQRTSKKDGKTQHFTVPVIEFYGRPLDVGAQFALPEGTAAQRALIPPVDAKAMPGTPPPLHSDGEQEPEPERAGIEPPAPYPQWVMDLPGSDFDVLDVASEVASEKLGRAITFSTLEELVALDVKEESQVEILRRLEERATNEQGAML